MFIVQSHRMSQERLERLYPQAQIVDVTSKGGEPWIKVSPFYPHGGIPVPLSPGYVSASVEGIWQGLKVFESADIDISKFRNRTMKNLKRTTRTYGRVLGHREGVQGKNLLGYVEARRAIYLPAYRWVLENRLQDVLEELRQMAQKRTVVLLDYETNCDINAISKPLSHAGLVKQYLEGNWPS